MVAQVGRDSVLASNLRVTLLVAAVLSLVAAPEAAAGKIEGVLEKVLPWKKGT